MKFMIIALMTTLPNMIPGEAFIFTTQTFKTVEECKTFARQNMVSINMRLIAEYGPKRPPRIISCVNEDVVKEMMGLKKEEMI